MKIHQTDEFVLKGSTADFNNRQKSVFAALDPLTPGTSVQRYSADEFRNSESKKTVSACRKDLKQFRGQESIFKRPEAPLKRSFKMPIPDFVKNPQKWKRYKMSDDIMTDESNTAAAMAFLREIKDRPKPMDVDDVQGPIVFNKHVLKDDGVRCAEEVENKSVILSSGKNVMPEYVVGQKVKKKVTFKKVDPAETSTQRVKLQHLFEEED